MAAKRNKSRNPAATTQAAKSTVPPVSPVVRRPLPSPVELRAEQEPAVDVAIETPIPASAPSRNAVGEWAPPPRQMGWWEQMFNRRREKKEAMAEHMAAVKAGVLQELETMGQKKGVAIKGSPFSTILLPVVPKRRFNNKWWLVLAALVVLIGLMLWMGRKPAQPEAVLGQAIAAVRNHDVRAFETHVDVAVVAASVVNQMFNVAPTEGGLAARMTAFAKPGLADGLKEEILAAVRGEALDDSGNTLLGKLWHVLGDDQLRVGTARVAMQNDDVAVAELPLRRADLSLTLPLQVVMTRSADSEAWQVTDIPNLGVVLDSIQEAEAVLAERRAATAAEDLTRVRVENVRKTRDSNGGGLNVSMMVANTGSRAAKDVQLEVAFGDAAGQPMMTTRLTLDGELPAGARREQVWSVPVDRARAAERYVADLPLSALTVTVTVVQ